HPLRMATSSSALSDHLYCAICTEIFTDPVSLSCQHTFCKRCLEQSREAGLRPHCPECRAPIMERNFQINRLDALDCASVEVEEALLRLPHDAVCVSGPIQFVCDVYAEELKTCYPLHYCSIDVDGGCSLCCFLKSTIISLVLLTLSVRLFS
uniref:RING-type domain-containing protein n=1 Tax=Oncorhynchus tshawytscha TaxID=74940 RepID=A0AAZ3PFQ6_ONCTS